MASKRGQHAPELKATPANVHDRRVFDDLVDPDNVEPGVWSDRAYHSEETGNVLQDAGYESHSMNRKFIRTIGLARAKVTIGVMNLTDNLMRYLQLTKDRKGVPVAARTGSKQAQQAV